jgi:chloramphenicol O-acetyltransferase
LKKFLEELYHRKLVVENKIRILKEDVKANHTQKKKAVPNLSFSQFGHPYFKEKDGTPLPGIKRFIYFLNCFLTVFLS